MQRSVVSTIKIEIRLHFDAILIIEFNSFIGYTSRSRLLFYLIYLSSDSFGFYFDKQLYAHSRLFTVLTTCRVITIDQCRTSLARKSSYELFVWFHSWIVFLMFVTKTRDIGEGEKESTGFWYRS